MMAPSPSGAASPSGGRHTRCSRGRRGRHTRVGVDCSTDPVAAGFPTRPPTTSTQGARNPGDEALGAWRDRNREVASDWIETVNGDLDALVDRSGELRGRGTNLTARLGGR